MLAYYHIPKTAGTSCKRVLESWYPTLIRDSEYSSKSGSGELAGSDFILTGHFACRLVGHPLALLDLAPDLRGASAHCIFTVLREPLEHAVSAYYHLKDVDKDPVGGLIAFLEQGHPFMHSMALAIPSAEYIQPALDSFSLVGDTADMQLSLDRLADILEKSKMEVPAIRMGTRDPQLLSLTAAERSRFERLWPLEFEIYEAARDRLRKGVSSPTPLEGNSFAYVDKTRAVVDSIREQLERRRSEAARASAGLEIAMPELSSEMAALLNKKDDQIRELESKVIAADERNAMLLTTLDSHRGAATEQRNSLVAKLHTANERYATLKTRVEEREKQVKESRTRIQVLTSKLEAVEAAHAHALQELKTIAETHSNETGRSGADRTRPTEASIVSHPNSGAAWQTAMANFMRDLEGALSDIRTTVDQLDTESPRRLAALSTPDRDMKDDVAVPAHLSPPSAEPYGS